MPKHGGGHSANVVAADVVATVQHGACLRRKYEVLAGTRTGAPTHVVADDVENVAITDASLPRELDRVSCQMVGNRHAANNVRQLDDILCRQRSRELCS